MPCVRGLGKFESLGHCMQTGYPIVTAKRPTEEEHTDGGGPRHAVQDGSRIYNRNVRRSLLMQAKMMNSSRSKGNPLSLP